MIAGKALEASEVYPASEQWGTYGFTYRSLDKPERKWTALSRFDWLLGRAKSPERSAFVIPQPIMAIQTRKGITMPPDLFLPGMEAA